MKRLRSTVERLLGLCCLLAALPAGATLFCVDNGTELDEAIGTAAVNGQDDEIRMTEGHIGLPGTYQYEYDYNRPIWGYRPIESDLDKSLTISGGWTPENLCQQQTGQPADTVVDAATWGSAFYFRAKLNFSPGADQTLRGAIALRNFTIEGTVAHKNDNPGDPGADAAAIQYVGLTQNASLTVERVVVREAQVIGTSNSVISVNVHGTGSFKLIGNAVFDSNLYGDNGSTAVRMQCEGGAICSLNNNSIHDNVASSNALSPGLLLGGLVNAANNVVADNTFLSVETIAQAGPIGAEGALDLRNNHFQSEGFVSPYNMSATTYGSANWTRVGLHRIPDLGSHLRNSGRNSPFGGIGSLDITGNPRVREGTVDRGAHETINLPPVLSAPASTLVSAVLDAGGVAYSTSISDPDGSAATLIHELSFVSCTPMAAANLFSIDTQGRVRLTGNVPANVNSCFIVAKVRDGNIATEASTTVTFNRPPVLSDATTTLPAAAPNGTIVHTFAAQDDNLPSAVMTYSLIGFMGPSNPFALESNGRLTLAQPLPAQPTTYTLSVKVCDGMPLCDTGALVIETGEGVSRVFQDDFEN